MWTCFFVLQNTITVSSSYRRRVSIPARPESPTPSEYPPPPLGCASVSSPPDPYGASRITFLTLGGSSVANEGSYSDAYLTLLLCAVTRACVRPQLYRCTGDIYGEQACYLNGAEVTRVSRGERFCGLAQSTAWQRCPTRRLSLKNRWLFPIEDQIVILLSAR